MNIYVLLFLYMYSMQLVIREYQCTLPPFNLTKPEYYSIYFLLTIAMRSHQRMQFLRASGTNNFSRRLQSRNHTDHFHGDAG